MKIKNLIFLSIILIASACEEVIDIDLNDASPSIVIEGKLTDQLNGCSVRITKSVKFDQSNDFPTVDNAIVTITDEDGNVFNLGYTQNGYYANIDLIGEYNKQYFLKVAVDGKTYEATSTMPNPVPVDSLEINEFAFFGNTTKLIDIYLNDPVDQENYYKFIPYVNNAKYYNLEILDDQFTNGQPVNYSIFLQDYELVVGDSVVIEAWNIDKQTYDYFDSLGDIIDGGSQSAAPANPNTNLTNGALGYFSAHTVSLQGILVE
jgi:hypothetical protein